MNAAAPEILVAIEASAAALAIRQSVWIYPLANVLHVMALAVFAGAVAILDLRLVGCFAATRPASVVKPARRAAATALGVLFATGLVLFAAEASHVALNAVFQIKAGLIVLGLANALLLGRLDADRVRGMQPHEPFPARVKLAAAISLVLWLAVAMLGRLIAYF